VDVEHGCGVLFWLRRGVWEYALWRRGARFERQIDVRIGHGELR
jgi:hypothetical protein